MLVTCNCGCVEMIIVGAPIMSNVCYCDSCQEGWGRIEALENAAPVLDARGGTEYVFYRKDRATIIKGMDLLQAYKLTPDTPMKRVVACCCNTAMFADRGDFYALIRARLGTDAPAVEMRNFTKFSPEQPFVSDDDVPTYPGVPARFIRKLIQTQLNMKLGL